MERAKMAAAVEKIGPSEPRAGTGGAPPSAAERSAAHTLEPASKSPAELDPGTLRRCALRDPTACRAFVRRYERAVFALLSRLLGQGPHVNDLAQETFLRAFKALPEFDPAGSARPSTWLLTIATRLALDAKKRKVIPIQPLDPATDPPGAGTPETERARAELGRAIETAAAALSDDQRAAFVLAELHGLSLAEIAEALGIPENTAKTRLHRARLHMRERLAPFYRGDHEPR